MKRFASAAILSALLSTSASADILISDGVSGIERYSNAGVSLGTFASGGNLNDARGLAIAPNGDVYVADFFDDQILRYNAAGVFQGIFASGAAIDVPFDIAFGPDGDLFVGSSGNDSVVRVNKNDGSITSTFTFGNATPIGGPHYITFGPTLVVTDIAGRVFRFNAATGEFVSVGFLDNPEGAAFNALGDLFVAQRISDNVIKQPAGGGPAVVVVPHDDFEGSPADLQFGPDGLLYLATSDFIYRYDTSVEPLAFVDRFGRGGQYIAFTAPIPEPGTWALAGAGLALVAFLKRRNK